MKQPYKYAHIITKLKKNDEGTALILDVPFKLYAQTIICKGKDLTYRLHDLKNDGKEVLACVSYSNDAVPFANEVDESEIAEKFVGYLGHKWVDVSKEAKYLEHYNVKKKDALATYDELGNKTEYDGIDKEEVTKFRQFDEEIVVYGL